MNTKRMGSQTVRFSSPVPILASASIGGKKEGEGPLRDSFDILMPDAEWNEETWEKTESKMQKEALRLALQKADCKAEDIHYVLAGDLLNQCIGAGFGLRELGIPFYGVYGACSTMVESLSLASMLVDGGYADHAAAVTSSHFCTAERQYRTPLEYGGQRTPTAQWTVTGAGAVVLGGRSNVGVTHVTTGKIVDMGVKDPNNMGGAMAPSAINTIKTHFQDTGRGPADYDYIITGDLGTVGSEILIELRGEEGYDISKNHKDCGCMIFDGDTQDVHAGGSGCGCVGSVFCGHILKELSGGAYRRILLIGTGALLSPTTSLQGESVPGIAHAAVIERLS